MNNWKLLPLLPIGAIVFLLGCQSCSRPTDSSSQAQSSLTSGQSQTVQVVRAKVGVWKYADALKPWEYRKKQRQGK